MSALGTWAPSAASQESKAPEALTHGEGSTSKAGGVALLSGFDDGARTALRVIVDDENAR